MKQLVVIACLMSLLISCKEEPKDLGKAPLAYVEVPKESLKELYGLWTGTIKPVLSDNEEIDSLYEDEPKRITLKINRISKDSVFGQSIIAGTQRPLKGVWSKRDGRISFVLDEPGKNPNDGRFEVSVYDKTMEGSWIIYKPNKAAASTKTLKLVQKKFVYNPNFMLNGEWEEFVDWEEPLQEEVRDTTEDGQEVVYLEDIYRVTSEEAFKINASTDSLTEESLKNLRKLDLEIIRNSVFARHGYSFKKRSFRYFFESSEWYVPVSDNVDNELTALEKQNITLLKRMEEYATDHYDTFGR